MSTSTRGKNLRSAKKAVGITGKANNAHGLRYTAGGECIASGGSREVAISLLHHRNEWDKVYSQHLTSHGFENREKYVLGRAMVDISKIWPQQWEKCKSLIVPQLDQSLQIIKMKNADPQNPQDISGEYFLTCLEWLRSVWLQGKFLFLICFYKP
jgi:hypothetical protein